jgi:hypothetical protein
MKGDQGVFNGVHERVTRPNRTAPVQFPVTPFFTPDPRFNFEFADSTSVIA